MFSPDRAAFLEAAAAGANLIPLAKSWPADLETPLTTWIKVGADVLQASCWNPLRVVKPSVAGAWWPAIRSGRHRSAMQQPERRWRDGDRCDAISGNP